MTTGKTKNVLTKAENYKLIRWLDEKKDTLENLTQPQIAKLATAEIGHTVTVANVYGACNVLGIKLGQRELRGQIYYNFKNSTQSQTIAKHLVYLYTKLGEPVPQPLQEIASS
jgi:hypothetical protein